VQVSEDGDLWKEVHCGRVFDGNDDRNTKVKNLFDYPVKARWVRILPQTWCARENLFHLTWSSLSS
jgi:hypothetical protein